MESGNKFRFASLEDFFLQRLFYLDDCTYTLVILLFLSLTIVGCDRHSDLHSDLQATKDAETQGTGEISNCTETPFPMIRPADPKTGHHKVVLSWKASLASADPDKNPV